jgi:hypothetical protein
MPVGSQRAQAVPITDAAQHAPANEARSARTISGSFMAAVVPCSTPCFATAVDRPNKQEANSLNKRTICNNKNKHQQPGRYR